MVKAGGRVCEWIAPWSLLKANKQRAPNYWAAYGLSAIFLGAWSANGYGIIRPGFKTGLENCILTKLA